MSYLHGNIENLFESGTESIAQSLHLPDEGVKVILDDLKKHKTFLFRDERGAVAWAYPVTVEL